MGNFKKGFFTPQNYEKYKGTKRPLYRSAWECRLMQYFDKHPAVTGWASEPFPIAYFNPTKGKISRYYPDFIVTYRTNTGIERTELIEVKPYRQTIPPKASQGKKQSTLLIEAKLWSMNCAKWESAKKYCSERGMSFRIMTEKELALI